MLYFYRKFVVKTQTDNARRSLRVSDSEIQPESRYDVLYIGDYLQASKVQGDVTCSTDVAVLIVIAKAGSDWS